MVNLTKLLGILKTARKLAIELGLEPSLAIYNKYGKGAKTRLRCSKSGSSYMEDIYSTHYINKKRMAEIKLLKLNKPEPERLPEQKPGLLTF